MNERKNRAGELQDEPFEVPEASQPTEKTATNGASQVDGKSSLGDKSEEEELERPTWEQRKDTAALEQRQQRERTATIEQMIDALAEQKKRHQRELEALEELQRNERLRAWQQRKAAEAQARKRSSRSPQVARPSRP